MHFPLKCFPHNIRPSETRWPWSQSGLFRLNNSAFPLWPYLPEDIFFAINEIMSSELAVSRVIT